MSTSTTSLVDLTSLEPAAVLRSGDPSEYQDAMAFFQSQLVLLNAGLFVAERMLQYPLHLFAEEGKQDGFRVVLHALLQTALMTITRCLTDQGKDCQTLRHFFAQLQTWLRPKYVGEFEARWNALDTGVDTSDLETRAARARTTLVAHNLLVPWDKASRDDLRITLDDLKSLRDKACRLFRGLWFSHGYGVWLVQYDPQVLTQGEDRAQPDVDRCLDLMAKNSALLSLPERDHVFWQAYRPALNPADRATLNTYRQRFGMKEV